MSPRPFEPDGWIFEDSDPEVGIFGYGWWHDACPSPRQVSVQFAHGIQDVDEPSQAEEFEIIRFRKSDITVQSVTRLVCADCNAEAVFVWDDFDPTPEWEAEEGRRQAEYEKYANELDSYPYDQIGSRA